MAPKVDNASDAGLITRYDEMYDNSPQFRSRIHNVVTSSRALLLILDPGNGDAHYVVARNAITVCANTSGGVVKTAEQVRNDLFFELHNAKKVMALSDLQGSKGYNAVMLVGDARKSAGYALAMEWVEWNNVAESTILVEAVNGESGIGQLLSSPAEYRANFDPGVTSWTKFSNYVALQVAGGHTAHYDRNAKSDKSWIGHRILEVLAKPQDTALTIRDAEIAPANGAPRLNSRANPFTWELVKALQLH